MTEAEYINTQDVTKLRMCRFLLRDVTLDKETQDAHFKVVEALEELQNKYEQRIAEALRRGDGLSANGT